VYEEKIYDVVYDDIMTKLPENDIDVYLSPLIEDLNFLWDQGVEVFDAYEKVNFNLRALLF